MLTHSSIITKTSSKSFTHVNSAARAAHCLYNPTSNLLLYKHQRGLSTIAKPQAGFKPLPLLNRAKLTRSSAPQTRTMANTTPADPAITEILQFWFEDLSFQDWFVDSAKHDKTITTRFGSLAEKARTTELDDTWLSTPSGSLAMIILLDQFSRNIYRVGNHPEPGLSFSGDAKALRIASQSIAKDFDHKIQEEFANTPRQGKTHRYFFYMPFMHAEDLPSQVAAVSLAETMAQECEVVRLQKQIEGKEETKDEKWVREWLSGQSVPFAKLHRNCVAQLGRFPKRNEPLGREHTEEEKKFLEEHPNGF